MPRALQQSPEYLSALRRIGAGVDNVQGVGCQTRRIPLFGTLRLITRADLNETELDALRQIRGPVLVSPESTVPGHCLRIARGVSVAELALQDPETMRRALHGKWRNRLTRAGKSGTTVRTDAFATRRHGWLLDLDTAQQCRRRYRGYPHTLLLAYAQQNPGKALAFTAHARGPVAGMIFLHHGDSATYLMGVTTAEGRARHAHTLLMWHAMCALQAAGVTQLDLGRTDLTPGITRFKLGTGAAERTLPGTFLWLPSLLPQPRRRRSASVAKAAASNTPPAGSGTGESPVLPTR